MQRILKEHYNSLEANGRKAGKKIKFGNAQAFFYSHFDSPGAEHKQLAIKYWHLNSEDIDFDMFERLYQAISRLQPGKPIPQLKKGQILIRKKPLNLVIERLAQYRKFAQDEKMRLKKLKEQQEKQQQRIMKEFKERQQMRLKAELQRVKLQKEREQNEKEQSEKQQREKQEKERQARDQLPLDYSVIDDQPSQFEIMQFEKIMGPVR